MRCKKGAFMHGFFIAFGECLMHKKFLERSRTLQRNEEKAVVLSLGVFSGRPVRRHV